MKEQTRLVGNRKTEARSRGIGGEPLTAENPVIALKRKREKERGRRVGERKTDREIITLVIRARARAHTLHHDN